MSIKKFSYRTLVKVADKDPAFFFDFDGTLAEIVPTPEEAGLKPIVKYIVEELARRYPIGIISGRKLREVRKLTGIKGIFYSGNHGVEIEGPELKFVEPNSAKSSGYITSLGKKIESHLRPYHPRINSKKFSVSIHYRTVEPAKVRVLLSELDKIISGPFQQRRIDVFHGKKVVEIKAPVEWDKGDAIGMILKKKSRNGIPVFFGDDTTDEYGFKKVNRISGLSILVGKKYRKTAAKYWIESPEELVAELAKFLFKME